jgi:hypothetical protein
VCLAVEISAEWGAQRIKGLSVIEAIKHALRKRDAAGDTTTKTSLIDRFLYPRLGPGQLWQEVARRVSEGGGEIRFDCQVEGLQHHAGKVTAMRVRGAAGQRQEVAADYVISTMAVKDLVSGMQPPAPSEVHEIASALPYRDFHQRRPAVKGMRANPQALSQIGPITCRRTTGSTFRSRTCASAACRSSTTGAPHLVADTTCIWLGLEYFCKEGRRLWRLDDAE